MGNKHKRLRRFLGLAIAGTLGFSLGNLRGINHEQRNYEESLSALEQEIKRSPYHVDLLINYGVRTEEEIPSDLGDLENAARDVGINVDSIRAQYKF